MAKKANLLADDFAGISKSADNNVLSILNEERHQKQKGTEQAPKSDESKRPDQNAQPRSEKPSRPQPPKPKKAPKIEDWGKPVAHFNTRIPEQMSDLLDDLIYKLRKKGTPKSKQELAQEALFDLLRKHSMC